jgi:GNAT superfamily N-acetyltransferase
MEVRPARVDEQDALAALFMRSRNQGMRYVPPVPEEALPRIAADLFERNDDVWVAEEAGRVLGFLAIRRSRRNGWQVLERLYVEPDEQGRGVGTALLEQAKALRPGGLYLWVFEKNTGARRLYERHGFRLVALRLGAAADNGEREADALYAWPGVSLERGRAASDRESSVQ